MNRQFRRDVITVERDGYSLFCEAIAPERSDSSWLIFGNSLVTDLSIWEAQANAFAGEFGILRYDQCGHGNSGQSPRQLSFDDLGADLVAIMDAAKVDRGIYVGLSMGVPTGLAAHRASPERFTGLVFSDGQSQTAPGGAAAWADRIKGAEATGMKEFANTTAHKWLTATSSAAMKKRLIEMISLTTFEGFQLCATALQSYDYTEELSRINCPTLLIAGAEDGAMPDSMASKLKPAIAGATMAIIDHSGHVPCFEQPNAFNEALKSFLDRNGFSSIQLQDSEAPS